MSTHRLEKNILNKDQTVRDIILKIDGHEYHLGGTCHYESLTVEKLEELIKDNFIDLDEKQNSAPTVREFYEFMKKYPFVKAHGYAVDKRRRDYRVSIEGLHYTAHGIIKDLQLDFMRLCRKADELTCTEEKLYSWWD